MTFSQKFWVFVLFLAVGPPIGSLLYAPIIVFGALESLADPAGLFLGFVVLFLYSYLPGLLPAGLAGAIFILLAPRFIFSTEQVGYSRAISGGAICGLLGASVYFQLFELNFKGHGETNFKTFIFMFLLPGLVGGGACGYFAKKLLSDPLACPQLSKEAVSRWALSVLLMALFFGLLAIVDN
jgi:hypothetical protein